MGGFGDELGDGAFHDAGGGPQPPVGHEVVQDVAADGADEVDDGVGDDPGGVDELVAGGVQGDGEAAPVGIDVGLGEGGVEDRCAERLVGDEQGVDLLLDPARGAGAQHPAAEGGRLQLQERGLDLPPIMVQRDDLSGGAVGVEDRGDQPVDPGLAAGGGGDGDLAADDLDLDRADPRHVGAVAQPAADRELAGCS